MSECRVMELQERQPKGLVFSGLSRLRAELMFLTTSHSDKKNELPFAGRRFFYEPLPSTRSTSSRVVSPAETASAAA